jgi:hypothetical protein
MKKPFFVNIVYITIMQKKNKSQKKHIQTGGEYGPELLAELGSSRDNGNSEQKVPNYVSPTFEAEPVPKSTPPTGISNFTSRIFPKKEEKKEEFYSVVPKIGGKSRKIRKSKNPKKSRRLIKKKR